MLRGRTRLSLLESQLRSFNAFVSSYGYTQSSTTPTIVPSTSQSVALPPGQTLSKSLQDSHATLNHALGSANYNNIVNSLRRSYHLTTAVSFPAYAISYTLDLMLQDPIPDDSMLDGATLLFKYARRIDAVPYDTSTVELFAKVFCHLGQHERAFKLLRTFRRLNKFVGVDVIESVAKSMEDVKEYAMSLDTLSMIPYDEKPTINILNLRLRSSIACEDYKRVNLVEFEHFDITPNQDTYHALIFGELLNGNLEQSKSYLSQMRNSGFTDNVATHLAILRAYRSLGIDPTLEHHALNDTAKLGLNADARVLNALMMLRIDAEDDRLALRIFEKFFNHSKTTNDTSLESLVKETLESRNTAFKKPHPDAATYAIVIQVFARNGNLEMAKFYYEDYKKYINKPNSHVESAFIKAHVSAGELPAALNLLRNGHIRTSARSINALFKGGLSDASEMKGIYTALRLFKRSKSKPDHKTLELIIQHLHNLHMPPSKLLRILNKLIAISSHRISLNMRLFNIIRLSTSDHVKAFISQPSKSIQVRTPGVGKKHPTYIPSYESISKIQDYLERKGQNDDGMSITIKMRLLAISGEFEEAKAVLKEIVGMGYKPTKYHFGALIEGATQNGNFSLAKSIIQQAGKAGVESNSIMYSIISAGYAKAGKLVEAGEMFDWMLTKKMKVNDETIHLLVKAHLDAQKPRKALKISRWLDKPPQLLDDNILATLYRLYDHNGMYKESDEIVKHIRTPNKILRDTIRLMKKRREKKNVYKDYSRSNWTKVHLFPGAHKTYTPQQLKRLIIEWSKVWNNSRKSSGYRRSLPLSRYSRSRFLSNRKHL
ncbi:hypothetical protein E3Q15_01244 [Wallemia mellicola]|nr:hypothetical protein E3Q15_01244 [Wallemia mellicola]